MGFQQGVNDKRNTCTLKRETNGKTVDTVKAIAQKGIDDKKKPHDGREISRSTQMVHRGAKDLVILHQGKQATEHQNVGACVEHHRNSRAVGRK